MTKKLSQATKDQIKDLIIEGMKKQKPETAKQLISLIQQTQDLSKEEITELLIELENENKIHFNKEPPVLLTVNEYVFSSKAVWYWTTIMLAAVTIVTIFTIPVNAVPLVYLRSTLGFIFVVFLPGFAFIKALFPAKVPIKTSSENMDTIEQVVLSFGMSLALIPLVGLVLNYTPWGIRLTPITLSLLAFTVVFATTAVLREYQAKAQAVKPVAPLILSDPLSFAPSSNDGKVKRSMRENIDANSQTPSPISEANVPAKTPATVPNTSLGNTVSNEQNNYLNDKTVKSSVGKNIDANILEIEIEPNALDYLKKNGDVFILTDIKNPQYTYYKIKGYAAYLIIEFKEFFEVCKTNVNKAPLGFTSSIFTVTSPIDSKNTDWEFYVAKSGFSTVDDWLKKIKTYDEIPECSTGKNKIFYLYYIQTVT